MVKIIRFNANNRQTACSIAKHDVNSYGNDKQLRAYQGNSNPPPREKNLSKSEEDKVLLGWDPVLGGP